MYNKCCVVTCGSRRKDVSLHQFPKSEKGLKKWLQSINCERLRNLDYHEIRKEFVCQNHFEKRFFTTSKKRIRLCPEAYPTLFTSSEISSGIPKTTMDLDVTAGVTNDHRYCRKRRHDDHNYCLLKVPENQPKSNNTGVDKISTAEPEILPSTSMISCPEEIPTRGVDKISTVEHEMLPSTLTKSYTQEIPTIGVDKISTAEPDILPSTSTKSYTQEIPTRGVDKISTAEPEILPSTSTIICTEKIPTRGEGVHTPSIKKRRHVIARKNKLSPHCARLYKEYVKSRRQLNFNLRAKRALKFSTEKYFVRLTKKLNPLAKKFLWMQIKHCTKNARGRRFTDDEKLIALAIMKQSPKCYQFLQRLFILPSKYTLNKMISNLKIETGIDAQIFEAVKQEVNNWDEKKTFCSILFDEMALEPALTYDKHRDRIDGFVDLNKRSSDFADHALVFMLRGVVFKWQQPLAYYFCKGATSGIELKKIVKDVITAVGETGLKPIALICDQGSAFQAALKSLQEDTRRQQIISGEEIDDVIAVSGHTMSVIFDPPHLIKGLRNNFLTKNVMFNQKVSQWSDIVEVYKTDCNHAQMRLLHKLNDEHVIPEKIKKMKVRNCTRVFSKTVAATLAYTAQFSHYADGKPVSPTLKNTAEVVSFFDDLFDSVNGTGYNKTSKGKPLRQAVTENSPHHEFWRGAIQKLNNIKFVDKQGKEISVPSLKNWVSTLKSHQRIWKFLKEKNIKIMRPRYLNSDPIENFFGQIRAYNFRNINPDCHTFKATFRSLLITRFIKFHSDSFNCEEDAGEQLLKLKSLFNIKEKETIQQVGSPSSSVVSNWVERENIHTTAAQERLNIHSRAYTTGWVVRKITKIFKCSKCEDDLSSKDSHFDKSSVNNWITFREFKSIQQKKLTYPSNHAVRLFSFITQEANKYLETQPQQSAIIKNIKTLIKSKYLFEFVTCDLHKNAVVDCFLSLTLRLIVFNWCSVINKILKGTDVFRLQNKILPSMQLKAYQKFKTKLKNKKK